MKVQEYRDLIGQLSQAFASVRGAATDEERRREAAWARRAYRELHEAAAQVRASADDKRKANAVLLSVATYFSEFNLPLTDGPADAGPRPAPPAGGEGADGAARRLARELLEALDRLEARPESVARQLGVEGRARELTELVLKGGRP